MGYACVFVCCNNMGRPVPAYTVGTLASLHGVTNTVKSARHSANLIICSSQATLYDDVSIAHAQWADDFL